MGTWAASSYAPPQHLNINVDGVRRKYKRLALLEILVEHRIDVCSVTESHLRKRELKRIKFEGYTIIGEHCRQNPGRITGGVLILVRNAVAAEVEPEPSPFGPRSCIEACSIMLYPTDQQETAIKITGVYISPKRTRALTAKKFAKLSKASINNKTGEIQQHLLVGDFNTTSWTSLFHEWTQEEGIWKLVNPELPTISTGGCIDKFLYVPGPYIPSTFFPTDGIEPESMGEDTGAEESHFPADIWKTVQLSTHYAVHLRLPADSLHIPARGPPTINIKNLEEEEWVAKNREMQDLLEKDLPLARDTHISRNLEHFYNKLEWCIKQVFPISREEKRTPQTEGGLENFLRINSAHPSIENLQAALESKATKGIHRWVSQISGMTS